MLIILVFSISGCGQEAMNEIIQTQNGIIAIFSMSPADPVVMEPGALQIGLTNSSGQEIEGALVSCDLTMPGMTMPPNQLQLSDVGQGLYTADTTFTMSGNWRAQVTAAYNGEATTFNFDFLVK